MNDESNDDRGDLPPPDSTAAETPKRVVKRKPLWLCVPKEYGEVVTDDGDIQRSPISYELYECVSKTEIHKILSKLGLDAQTINPEHVKIFRADPLPLRLATQVSLKF